MFYFFRQNNSGGIFKPPAIYVIIEAENYNEANYLAETKDLYFDGCQDGMDCHCCGDRWRAIWKNDKGDKIPSIYGTPVEKHDFAHGWRKEANLPECIIYYKNGTVKELN